MPRPNNRFYDLLGTEPKADDARLRAAARRSITFAESSRSLSAEQKAARVADIEQVLAVLLDPELRRRYDRYGEAGLAEGFEEPDDGPAPMDTAKSWVPASDEVHSGPVADEPALDLEAVQVREDGDWLELDVPFRVACLGGLIEVPLGEEAVELTLAPGTADGDTTEVAGRPARLFLLPDTVFHRHDYDLVLDVAIEQGHAQRGIVLMVPTLEGQVKVKLPPGVRNGQKLRLRGKGVPHGDDIGDLYVHIEVLAPGTGRVRHVGVGRGAP